jgi:DNA-binding XRE family transcriptional regulator
MTIKEVRKQAGLTQAEMALTFGIPRRTIENWESGISNPPVYVKNLLIKEMQKLNSPKFKISNASVKNYAEICKKFANDTAEWGNYDEYQFYTTEDFDWKESSDNAHNGVDVSWAFHLTDAEIEMKAAEYLYGYLIEEITLAIDDGWEKDAFETIYTKFNF